jgi:ketosteroid isomerase-like protein
VPQARQKRASGGFSVAQLPHVATTGKRMPRDRPAAVPGSPQVGTGSSAPSRYDCHLAARVRPRPKHSARRTKLAQGAAPGDDDRARNVEQVKRFLAAFDRRWPTEAELEALIAHDVRFVERPNVIKPRGDVRDAAGVRAGIEAGRKLLAWQSYEIRDWIADGDLVIVRMRWTGELAVDAGPWPSGTVLAAWCVAHYRLHDGLIVEIEQHDCYEPARIPGGDD